MKLEVQSQEQIMNGWPENGPVLISIRCIAYNQEAFIGDTLNGFLIQRTNFPFEIVVHDDASTDRTAEIIREYAEKYPKIIKPIYEVENQFSKRDGSLARIMNNACSGKYIAFCEGDDYWIDPLKLQKQVEILERDALVQLVYTGFKCVDEDGKEIVRPEIEEFMTLSCSGDVFKKMMGRNFVMTLTMCVRRQVLVNDMFDNAPERQDYLISLIASGMGTCVYLPEKTSCYRKSASAVTQTNPCMVMKKNTRIRDYVFRLYLKGSLPRREGLQHVAIYWIYLKATIRGHLILFKWQIKKMFGLL